MEALHPESRRRCECGCKVLTEWSCEGSPKCLRVGAYGNPIRYHRGAYDGMQKEWANYAPIRVVPQE